MEFGGGAPPPPQSPQSPSRIAYKQSIETALSKVTSAHQRSDYAVPAMTCCAPILGAGAQVIKEYHTRMSRVRRPLLLFGCTLLATCLIMFLWGDPTVSRIGSMLAPIAGMAVAFALQPLDSQAMTTNVFRAGSVLTCSALVILLVQVIGTVQPLELGMLIGSASAYGGAALSFGWLSVQRLPQRVRVVRGYQTLATLFAALGMVIVMKHAVSAILEHPMTPEDVIAFDGTSVAIRVLAAVGLFHPTFRSWVHYQLAGRGQMVMSAAGIAGLFQGLSEEEIIRTADRTFRAVPLESLERVFLESSEPCEACFLASSPASIGKVDGTRKPLRQRWSASIPRQLFPNVHSPPRNLQCLSATPGTTTQRTSGMRSALGEPSFARRTSGSPPCGSTAAASTSPTLTSA